MITTQFDVFDFSFNYFIAMSQKISVVSRSGRAIFYTRQTSGACAGIYA